MRFTCRGSDARGLVVSSSSPGHFARGRNFDAGPGERREVIGRPPWLRHRLAPEREMLAYEAPPLGRPGLPPVAPLPTPATGA